MTDIVATAAIDISAAPEQVWKALVDPALIEKYMFGTHVETDWQPGSKIFWKGEYQGTKYEDKGELVTVEPPTRLVMTHFSPLSGQDDVPANYHTLTYELSAAGAGTHLSLSQDHNASEDEAEHSHGNWASMLEQLKSVVEKD